MPTAKNSKLQIEGGRTLHAFAAMTDSGDRTVFTIPGGSVFSGKSGFAPDVRPDGIVSGRNLLSPHGDNNKVNIAGFTCYLAGVLTTIAATTGTITRPATDVAKVNSITVDNTGAIAVVAGTDGSGSAFSEVRGAAGGPPFVPVGSIEIGQVRVAASADGAILSSEIFQNDGDHVERFNYPLCSTIKNLGEGLKAASAAKKNAFVEFASALPAVHTGSLAKGVYIQFYAPVFQDLGRVFDFVPAETSHGVSSKEYYRGSVASVTESIGQGSFTALLDDAIQDLIVSEKNEVLTLKYFPDQNRSPYILTQGKLGIKRSFPAGDQIQAAVTVSAEEASVEFSG
jgi:hypothetical protein